MTTSESKGRFFDKTNRFESIRITFLLIKSIFLLAYTCTCFEISEFFRPCGVTTYSKSYLFKLSLAPPSGASLPYGGATFYNYFWIQRVTATSSE